MPTRRHMAHAMTPRQASEPELIALGVVIRRLRRARHLSIEALARKTGMSSGHLGVVERGHGNPRMATLCDLAEALGVTFAQLVCAAEAEGKA
jgi:transcriptional regulator with XRE-family HTH domain